MKATTKWAVATSIFGAVIIFVFLLFGHGHKSEVLASDSSVTNDATLHPVETFTSPPSAKTLPDAFASAGLPYYPEDHISAVPSPSLGIGSVITVTRALPITLIDGKKQSTIRTWQSNVGDLLNEKNIELGADDRIAPSLITPLTTSMTVTIVRVAKTTVVETEDVPFQTVIQLDYNQFAGAQTVVRAGADGQVKKTYLVIRQDGEQISKTLTGTVTTKTAQSKIVKQGGLSTNILQHTSCPQYKSLVVAAGAKYGINPNSLFTTMIAESNCHATSVAAGGYTGLFQYSPGWWPTASAQAGYAGASIFDAQAQIYTTAYQWAHGQCRSRWAGTCAL